MVQHDSGAVAVDGGKGRMRKGGFRRRFCRSMGPAVVDEGDSSHTPPRGPGRKGSVPAGKRLTTLGRRRMSSRKKSQVHTTRVDPSDQDGGRRTGVSRSRRAFRPRRRRRHGVNTAGGRPEHASWGPEADSIGRR